jgi:predicted branched-subunit amino acid permease
LNRQFGQGFVTMLPLWAGAIPVGAAFAIAAREAGLGGGETQAMSLLVFSAAAQIAAVALLRDGAPSLALVGAALALNVQLLLLGLAVGRRLRPSRARRPVLAFLLTDGAFAIAAGGGRLSVPGLLGAGASMYLGWNLGTALGVAGGGALPDLHRSGGDLVVPLAFLAVLAPLLRTRSAVATAVVAGVAALLLGQVVPGGIALLGASLTGSAAGAWWADARDKGPQPTAAPATAAGSPFPPSETGGRGLGG